MDSEDNLNNFYGDRTNPESDNEDEVYVSAAADNFDDGNTAISSCQEQNYKILSKADIQRLQEDDILKLSNILFISSVEASILLCSYSWNSGKLQDEWFIDEDHVRRTVGLLKFLAEDAEKPNERGPITCNICFELHLHHKTSAAACGHRFCDECWQGYIASSIRDGLSCLTLRCPDPSCFAAVGQDMIDRMASNEDKERYHRFLLRSYVEGSRSIKWCPAPGCEFAVEFEVGSTNCDIYCRCSYQFCWDCAREAHRPIDCNTMDEWMSKNNEEAGSIIWILANSKPCPKCKRRIEKNHGCMHMTCSPPCEHHFCWICLGNWEEHDVQNNGFYYCNALEKTKKVGVEDEFQRRKKMAKMSTEMHTHYYERWAANHLSWQKALVDLQSMQNGKLESLRNSQNETDSQVKFVIEAWEQIVECRRMLKWTYAYGFYLPEDEQGKRQFFEYLQGEAEIGLERLHQCAEKELQVYLYAENPSQEFSNFRRKLVDLTSVTRKYFKNLVRALEKELQEVACSYKGPTMTVAPREQTAVPTMTVAPREQTVGPQRKVRRAPRSMGFQIWSCNC